MQFNPQAGHEQSGYRPALVISPSIYNRKAGLALMCPITSQIKGYPFEAVLPQGLKIGGAVLSDHVKSLDWRARRAKYIDRLPPQALAQVIGRLIALIRGA